MFLLIDPFCIMGGESWFVFPRDLLRAQPSDSRLAKPKEHETAF